METLSAAFKKDVRMACIEAVSLKAEDLKAALSELEEGSANDSKSSAGDKHETARAMMQLEQEKLSLQLRDTLARLDELRKLSAEPQDRIGKGSLLNTSKGLLYIAQALGKIRVGGHEVMVISLQSPLGTKLLGLQAPAELRAGDTVYRILEAC